MSRCTCEWLGDCSCEIDRTPPALTPAKACQIRLKTQKSRDASPKSVTASTENPSEKESVMNNVTELPQAPAGFKEEPFCACGLGCTPGDADDICDWQETGYCGPGFHVSNSTAQLNTSWSRKNGISFHLAKFNEDYTNAAWTRHELEQLPAMVKSVLGEIDYHAAKQHFQTDPEPLKRIRTVQDLHALAQANNLSTSAVMRAWEELTAAEAPVATGKRS